MNNNYDINELTEQGKKAFNKYIEKYCTINNCSLEEAEQHEMIKLVFDHFKDFYSVDQKEII